MCLSKILSSASDIQLNWTVKDLQCCFETSALSWRLKIWNSASTLPLCLDYQRYVVLRPHFRSALTAKNVKFRFYTSALPWLPNMWSSTSALPLYLDWQSSEVPLSALVLPGLPKMWISASAFHLFPDFQRFAVSLLYLSLSLDCQRSENRLLH